MWHEQNINFFPMKTVQHHRNANSVNIISFLSRYLFQWRRSISTTQQWRIKVITSFCTRYKGGRDTQRCLRLARRSSSSRRGNTVFPRNRLVRILEDGVHCLANGIASSCMSSHHNLKCGGRVALPCHRRKYALTVSQIRMITLNFPAQPHLSLP